MLRPRLPKRSSKRSDTVVSRTRRNQTFMNQKYGFMKTVWNDSHAPGAPCW